MGCQLYETTEPHFLEIVSVAKSDLTMKYCSNCGHRSDDNAKFCGDCELLSIPPLKIQRQKILSREILSQKMSTHHRLF